MDLEGNRLHHEQPCKEEVSSLAEVKKGETVIFFHDPAIIRTHCFRYQGEGNCKIRFVNIMTDFDY